MQSKMNALQGMRLPLIAVAILAMVGYATPGNATTYNLTSLNTSVAINDGAGDSGGMTDWVVDGTDHLALQWFWFRVAGDSDETRLGDVLPTLQTSLTIGAAPINLPDPGPDCLTLTYQYTDFTILITYTIQGGTAGSGFSDIGEQITIFNTSETEALEIDFFQYSDFNLNDTPDDDTVELVNMNKVVQSDPLSVLSETTVVADPDFFEITTWDITLAKFIDGNPTDLSNTVVGPLFGDVTWAFQWTFSIGAGSSIGFSKDKRIINVPVPEPMTLALFGAGLIGMGVLRRRRRAAR